MDCHFESLHNFFFLFHISDIFIGLYTKPELPLDKIYRKRLAATAFDIAATSRSHILSTCSFYITRYFYDDLGRHKQFKYVGYISQTLFYHKRKLISIQRTKTQLGA